MANPVESAHHNGDLHTQDLTEEEKAQARENIGVGGGGGGCMLVSMNEDDAENQVYPEGLYDTIDNMIANGVFSTNIVVASASTEYNSIVFLSIKRIDKDEEGYAIKFNSPSSNRILHVRPDNSGWLEWTE